MFNEFDWIANYNCNKVILLANFVGISVCITKNRIEGHKDCKHKIKVLLKEIFERSVALCVQWEETIRDCQIKTHLTVA